MPFACSICEQESTRICVFCTKDACNIHICGRCGCCSDCCPCEVPLNEPMRANVAEAVQAISVLEPELAELAPPEFALSPELDAEFGAPGGEPGDPVDATPDAWTSDESQSATSEEPATEPSETPKV
ncbi:MAG: hypothetical protein DMG58_03700 [Acidobacteria bacterium]|nr:MAG: hypothetical protein DMG58_03700 [Acidobacteriota bacterium]